MKTEMTVSARTIIMVYMSFNMSIYKHDKQYADVTWWDVG